MGIHTNNDSMFQMYIDNAFYVRNRGMVVTGWVDGDSVHVGDPVIVVRANGQRYTSTVLGIEHYQKLLQEIEPGKAVGILLAGTKQGDAAAGDQLIAASSRQNELGYITVYCSKCGVPLRLSKRHNKPLPNCPSCGTPIELPKPPTPQPAEVITVFCSECGVPLHIPKNHTGPIPNCPDCNTPVFIPTTKVTTPPSPPPAPVAKKAILEDPPAPVIEKVIFDEPPAPVIEEFVIDETPEVTFEEPQKANSLRTVIVTRGIHAYTEPNLQGFLNQLKDAKYVHIYLDGVLQGTLSKTCDKVEFQIDNAEHRLSYLEHANHATLPAGKDSYRVMFFNEVFHIGIENDPFEAELREYVLKMVRGQGFQDRLNDSNNRNHAVELEFLSDYILVYYYLNETKGISQWISGRKEEKVYYHNIGLMPPRKQDEPTGYWSHIHYAMESAIVNDPQLNLTHTGSGYTTGGIRSL